MTARETQVSGSPLIIDVDTGVDDALALALAVGRGANILGVTTVAGNVGLVGLIAPTRSQQPRIFEVTGCDADDFEAPGSSGASAPPVCTARAHRGQGRGGDLGRRAAEMLDVPIASGL